MKICQILYSGLGGHGNVSFSLIDGDDSGKNEHCLIFFGIEDLLDEYRVKCIEKNIEFGFVKKKIGLDAASQLGVWRQLKTMNPDAIILHSSTLILPIFLFCVMRKTRLISVEHTPIISKRFKDWVFSFINCLLASYVVLLSEAYKNKFKSMMALNRFRTIATIPNGLNTEDFKPVNADRRSYNIGMLSRLSEHKNHKTLIKALKLISIEFKEIQLLIAGEGETKEELKKLASDLGLKQQITFLGLLQEREVIEFLEGISIYVHSSYSETMSTSIMQAMASGKPIVATDTEGIADLIIDDETGILFKKEDEVDLAEKVVLLLKNESLHRKLGNNARVYAKKNLSNKKMFQSYYELIS